MADEEVNNQENSEEQQEPQTEGQEETQEETVDQEELAKQWEEQLASQGENEATEESASETGEETIDQDELAKQWEEALAEQQSSTEDTVDQEDLAKQWEEALAEQQASSQPTQGDLLSVGDDKLDLILDIPLEITVEVGNKAIPLEDILKMTPNTIIELERYINEPVDIKVNGKLIAKGELYTVENNFGVKITSIITVQERMKLLMEEVE